MRKKRILSLLLALTLSIGLIPQTAMAADDTTEEPAYEVSLPSREYLEKTAGKETVEKWENDFKEPETESFNGPNLDLSLNSAIKRIQPRNIGSDPGSFYPSAFSMRIYRASSGNSTTEHGIQYAAKAFTEYHDMYDWHGHATVKGELYIDVKDSASGTPRTLQMVPFSKYVGYDAPQVAASSFLGPIYKRNLKNEGSPTAYATGKVTGPSTFQVTTYGTAFYAPVFFNIRYGAELFYDNGSIYGSGSWDDANGTNLTIDQSGVQFDQYQLVDVLKTGYYRIDNSSANTAVTASTATGNLQAAIDATAKRTIAFTSDYNIATDTPTFSSTPTVLYGPQTGVATFNLSADNGGKYFHASYNSYNGNTCTATVQIPAAVQITYDTQGGSAIAPSTKTFAGYDHTVTTAVPTRTGYTFKGWRTAANGGGTSVAAGSTQKLSSNLTLYAQWEAKYNVTTSKEGEGTISASISDIPRGESRTISYTPASGWFLDSVIVDGTPIDIKANPTSYTLSNISKDMTVKAVFYKGFNITTSITNGTITPNQTNLQKGVNKTITFQPNDGYYVKSITVDSTSYSGADLSKREVSFSNIQGDHNIQVVCAKDPVITITGKVGSYIAEKGSPEFSYKITGTDYLGKTHTYYRHLIANEAGKSVTMQIPAGNWTVTQLESDGWMFSSAEGTNATISGQAVTLDTTVGDASVTFANMVSDYDGYTANHAATVSVR